MSAPKAGKVVKLSHEVIAWINPRKLRKGEANVESYDAALRRFFGIPTLKGESQSLRKYYVIENEGEPLIFRTRAEARGVAIVRAVRKGSKKPEHVMLVVERALTKIKDAN